MRKGGKKTDIVNKHAWNTSMMGILTLYIYNVKPNSEFEKRIPFRIAFRKSLCGRLCDFGMQLHVAVGVGEILRVRDRGGGHRSGLPIKHGSRCQGRRISGEGIMRARD